jgi:cytochrome c oxidase subunit 4
MALNVIESFLQSDAGFVGPSMRRLVGVKSLCEFLSFVGSPHFCPSPTPLPSGVHYVHPVRTYVAVWAALTILTVTTWAVAQIDLGPFNAVIALVIAFFKASLVVWFFMDLRPENPLTKLFALGGLFWLLLLIGLTLLDYKTRSWMPGGKLY